jgi:CubicO group peptidase (beta-lactamase class C family)
MDQRWEALTTFASELREKLAVPGAVLGILTDGKTRMYSAGVTNLAHPLPVSEHALFQIGSITKTFTGTLIMRLVEAGELDLDTPIQSYVPEFRVQDSEATEKATIRHLLTHTGGWVGDFFVGTGMGMDAYPRYIASMAGLEQLAPLGTVWSYCNTGFSVLGAVIERVTGKPYEKALRHMLLEPLGLEMTYIDPLDVMTHRFVVGHSGGKPATPWHLERYAWSAGAITCTIGDLLRYAAFQLGDGCTQDGERLLTPESFAEMQRVHARLWVDRGWGLSWSVDRFDGITRLAHGGATNGQKALLHLYPEHGFAVAVAANGGDSRTFNAQVTKRAAKDFIGLEIPTPRPIQAEEAELEQYVGRYSRPFADLHVGCLAGRLVGQLVFKQGFPRPEDVEPAPPPMTLALCERDRLVVLDGPLAQNTAEVVRDDAGEIGWIRIGGRIHRRHGG